MYRIIYMQHVEIELYSLFVFFSFTFLCSNILYPYLFIKIIKKIIRSILSISISMKYSNI